MFQSFIKRYKNIILYILLLLIAVTLINISLGSDEQFTIGLIHNNYISMINFDSLDVHPPLYYILIKLFLQLTTFWTNSILIKIIFARIFSLLITYICIYFGYKIFKLENLKIPFVSICLIFLAVPGILLYSEYIRMYILAAMFLFVELYELLKYVRFNKMLDLFLSIIMGSLAAYTHYFAAISAGLFLLYFFIKFIYNKKIIKSLKLGASGIIYFVLYVPWMFIAKRQFSMATSSQYNTNQIYTKSTYTATNFIHLIKQALLSLVGGQDFYGNKGMEIVYILLLVLFSYLLYWSFKYLSRKFNLLLIISGINLVGTIIVGLLVSVIKHPILIDHYLFPSFAIFAFFMSYVIYQYIKKMFYINKLYKSISWLIILVLFMNVSLYSKYDVKNLLKSHAIITEMNTWHRSNHRDIYIKNNKKTIWNIADDSIYLKSMHKYIKTNNFKNTDLMFGKPDVKLMHGVYPNVTKN